MIRDIRSSGIAVVQVVRKQESSISSVVADYDACGYDTVNYLYSKGCRQIGFINGNSTLAPYRERYNGYHRAMQELGLAETCAVSDRHANTFEYGYECTADLLDQNPNLDAIMAAVDIQGMAALRALKDKGISVPGQIRLVSMTGYSIGELLETSMTALEIPAEEMGIKATQMLVDEIEAPSDAKPSVQHLVFRAS